MQSYERTTVGDFFWRIEYDGEYFSDGTVSATYYAHAPGTTMQLSGNTHNFERIREEIEEYQNEYYAAIQDRLEALREDH